MSDNNDTVQDILNDNIKLLQFYQRREARPGLWILSFDGALMPDGFECEVQVKGELNHQALMKACDEVRSTYNARIGREETEESISPPAREPSVERPDPPAAVAPRVDIPAPPVVPDIEATLESVIESQVTRLRDTIAGIESRIGELGEERRDLLEQLGKAERALGAYNDGQTIESEPAPGAGPGSTEEAADPEGPTTDGHEGED